MLAEPAHWSASSAQGEPVRLCESDTALIACGLADAAELALWQRKLSPEAAAIMAACLAAGGRDQRWTGPADLLRAMLETAAAEPDLDGAAAGIIRADVCRWMDLAEAAVPGNDYTLRIEHVSDDACRRFHKDRTDLRIITTYAGRGTQWIDTAEGPAPEVQELPTGVVGLFLGHRDGEDARILHRSPPISETGGARLVVVLDIERAAWLAHS